MPFYNKKDNNIARNKQLINKAPKKAHKEIFQDNNAQPRASLQAVKDPETGKNWNWAPNKLRFWKVLQRNIKHGTYLPEEAPRNYLWEHTENKPGNKPPDLF